MTPQKHSSRALYVRLLRHVWPYRHALLGAVVAMVVGGLADASLVKVGEYVVEELFVRHDRTYAAILPLAIVGVFFVSGVASFASGYGMQWIGNKVVLDLRREMFAKVLKLPPGFFDEMPTAQLVAQPRGHLGQVATPRQRAPRQHSPWQHGHPQLSRRCRSPPRPRCPGRRRSSAPRPRSAGPRPRPAAGRRAGAAPGPS